MYIKGFVVWFAGNLQIGYVWEEPFGLPLFIYKAGWSIKMIKVSGLPPNVFELSGLCEMMIGGDVNDKTSGIWGEFKYHMEKPVEIPTGGGADPSDIIPTTGFSFSLTNFSLQRLLELFVPGISNYLPSWLDVGFAMLKFSNCQACLFPLMFEAGPGNIQTIEPGVLLHAKEFYIFDKVCFLYFYS